MALQIYVGNYPSTFTSEDLINLFKNFQGVVLLTKKKVNKKCFAFFLCMDEHQVIDVVTTMHDIDVGGRRLVVRASNEEMQHRIAESFQENYVFDKHPRNSQYSHCDANRSSSGFNSKTKIKPCSSGSHSHAIKSNGQNFNSPGTYLCSKHQEENVDEDGACQSKSLDQPKSEKDFFCVSVANFPYNTSISSLYELFMDIDPYNIVMIKNFPTRDGQPTEAILCLESEEQVTDAIMNFDNTNFQGRALLVNDLTDPTMLKDLLIISAKNS